MNHRVNFMWFENASVGVNFNLSRASPKKPPLAFVNWSLGGDFPFN